MASKEMGRGAPHPHASIDSPSRLHSQDINRSARFSFVAETPLQLQGGGVGLSSPTDTYIDESPTSPAIQHPMQQPRRAPQPPYEPPLSRYADEKKDAYRLGSPYPLVPPQQPHPALSAPYAEPEHPTHQQQQQSYHYSRP
ncbi:MAG: hypothetical protein LQ340_001333, partial [Diploschistes diacapsis]